MATATEAPATAEGLTSHTQNQDDVTGSGTFGYTREQQIEALRKLREPFDPAEIRYLPRVWCASCRNSKGRGCDDHPRRQCRTCGQNIPPAHIDLRYVGHAEATNRLLNVDPFWDWEPLGTDANGLPQYDGNRGLWILLTVCGMTRRGYGHAGDKSGGDAVKEIIGDAIRNAGMRFGMALDLWTSSDLQIVESGGTDMEVEKTSPSEVPTKETPSAPVDAALDALKTKVTRGWISLDATRQNLLDATAKGLVDTVVPSGPHGEELIRLGDLLKNRIAELEAAKGGSTERSAA